MPHTEHEKLRPQDLLDAPRDTNDWQDRQDLKDDSAEFAADHLEQVLGDEPSRTPDSASAILMTPSESQE